MAEDTTISTTSTDATNVQLILDERDMRATFTNAYRIHTTAEEVVVDFGFNIQAAMEAPRFTKGTFDGCDVSIESRVPEDVRKQLIAWGHEVRVTEPISGSMGRGNAVTATEAGVGGVHVPSVGLEPVRYVECHLVAVVLILEIVPLPRFDPGTNAFCPG